MEHAQQPSGNKNWHPSKDVLESSMHAGQNSWEQDAPSVPEIFSNHEPDPLWEAHADSDTSVRLNQGEAPLDWWEQREPETDIFATPEQTPWWETAADTNNQPTDHLVETAKAPENPFSEIVASYQEQFDALSTTGSAVVPSRNLLAMPGSEQPSTIESTLTFDEIAERLGGWKLHLNFDVNNPFAAEKVKNLLQAMRHAGQVANFKVGDAGDQEGKSATIYIGHRDKASFLAGVLRQQIGDVLIPASGDALRDDMSFVEKDGRPLVVGRFDIGGKIDDDVQQYGTAGIPYLKADASGNAFNRTDSLGGLTADQKIQRSTQLLTSRYGSFFTGNPVVA